MKSDLKDLLSELVGADYPTHRLAIIGFDGSDYPIMSVLRWVIRLDDQNDRLRNRIAINRLCRAMYREPKSKQNMRFAPSEDFRQAPRHLRVVK
jgi:hypothetical protein